MWPTKFIPLKVGLLLVIFLSASKAANEPSAELVLTHMESIIYAKDIVKIFDYRLIPYRGRNVINGSVAYYRVLAKKNMRLLLEFEKPDKTRFQMLDLKLDVCKLLRGDLNGQKMFKIVGQQLAEQKQFLRVCPQEANKTYDLIMYDVRAPHFPLPNLKVIATVIMFDDDNVRKLTELRLKGATKRRVST